jgi:exopolysaccharide production protein ExoY
MNISRHKARLSESPPRDSILVPFWKRALDLACILVALPVLLPLALLIALLIKIVSAGPVLFKQERTGYLGRSFVCLKFRTMAVGADTAVHQKYSSGLIGSSLPMVKMDSHGDARLIPFGLLLRISGLDELPQIINVLRGEMSLVGPRPCLRYECDRYLPWQRERFNTLPGLTGLWQVSGKNRTTFDQMIRLDIHYARSKSLWLDLNIMFRTIPALIVQVQDTRRERKRRCAPRVAADGRSGPDGQSTIFANDLFLSSSKQLVQSSTEEHR